MFESVTKRPVAYVFLLGMLCLCGSLNATTSSANLKEKIRDAAKRASLDPNLVEAVVRAESNLKVRARSPKGAMGLMQVMPGTADGSGIHDPYHPMDNLMGACVYLRQLINRYDGDIKLALAAYNAGPGNVDKYKGIPPFDETQKYVKRVLKLQAQLRRAENF